MADSYKRLGAIAPADSYEKVLYSTAAGKSALVSNITVTNRGQDVQKFSINVHDSLVTENDIEPVPGSINVALQTNDYQAQYDVVAVSTNGGTTWTSVDLPGAGQGRIYPEIVVAGNGCIAICPKYGDYYYASIDNGATFTAYPSPYGYSSMRLFFVNNQFLLTPDYPPQGGGFFYVSSDAVTWTPISVPDLNGVGFQSGIDRIHYGNGLYFILPNGWSTAYLTSPDLATWTLRTLPGTLQNSPATSPLVYDGSKFVLIGGNDNQVTAFVSTSVDGITWTTANTSIPQALWTSLATNGTSYVMGYGMDYWTESSSYLYSTDGTTWVQGTLPFSGGRIHISWNGQKYIAIPSSSMWGAITVVGYSTDGVTWNTSSLPSPSNWGASFGDNATQYYESPASKSIYREVTILPNETEVLEPGIALNENNTILVNATSQLTVSAFGVELDASDKYKILSQGLASAPGTETVSYAVPSGKQALIRSIVVSNTSDDADYYDISISPDGTTPTANVDYLFKGYEIAAKETVIIKAGYTLDTGNSIRIKSTNATTNFTFFGVEL